MVSKLTARFKRVHYPFAVSLLFVAAVPLIAPTEVPYLHKPDLVPWAVLKAISVLIALPALVTTWKRKTSDLAIGLLFFAVCFQSFTSGLYRPLYELGYFQVAIACSFIQTRNKWMFALIFGIGAVFMATLVYWRAWLGIAVEPVSDIDMAIAVFIFFIIAAIIYYTVAGFREERSVHTMRLSLLGQHSIQLAHDLKGVLSGPLLHVTALQDRKDEFSQGEMKNVVNYLKEDLANASRVLAQMSEMAHSFDKVVQVELRSAIEAVLVLFQRRFARSKIEIDAEGSIETDPRRFQFILFNVLLNCAEQMGRQRLEALEQSASATPHVRVFARPNRILIADNCGGMDEQILKTLKSGGRASSKSDGGLGFQIIQAEARALKLELNFKNEKSLGSRGFHIELSGF